MKIRVFKRQDNSIIVSRPSKKYFGGKFINDTSKPIYETDADRGNTGVITSYEQRELTIDDCKFPPECDGLEYIDIDSSELPLIDNSSGIYQEMLYIEDQTIKIDDKWQLMLMPNFLVKKKYINYLRSSVDSELSKDSPDHIELVRNYRKLEIAKETKSEDDSDGDLFWTQKALEGLARAETEKPVIKAKLEAKIVELEK